MRASANLKKKRLLQQQSWQEHDFQFRHCHGLNNSRQHRPAGASHFKRAIIGRAAPQRTGRRPERKRKGPETELNPQSPPTTTKAGRASEHASAHDPWPAATANIGRARAIGVVD